MSIKSFAEFVKNNNNKVDLILVSAHVIISAIHIGHEFYSGELEWNSNIMKNINGILEFAVTATVSASVVVLARKFLAERKINN